MQYQKATDVRPGDIVRVPFLGNATVVCVDAEETVWVRPHDNSAVRSLAAVMPVVFSQLTPVKWMDAARERTIEVGDHSEPTEANTALDSQGIADNLRDAINNIDGGALISAKEVLTYVLGKLEKDNSALPATCGEREWGHEHNMPCVLPPDHREDHRSARGLSWPKDNSAQEPCSKTFGGEPCVLKGHHIRHRTRKNDRGGSIGWPDHRSDKANSAIPKEEFCSAENPKTPHWLCNLSVGHVGPHIDPKGNHWPNSAIPQPSSDPAERQTPAPPSEPTAQETSALRVREKFLAWASLHRVNPLTNPVMEGLLDDALESFYKDIRSRFEEALDSSQAVMCSHATERVIEKAQAEVDAYILNHYLKKSN